MSSSVPDPRRPGGNVGATSVTDGERRGGPWKWLVPLLLALAAVVVLLLLLSQCGSDDDPAAAAPTTPSAHGSLPTTPTDAATPTDEATATDAATPTDTATATATDTATPTDVATATDTATPTGAATPSSTASASPSATTPVTTAAAGGAGTVVSQGAPVLSAAGVQDLAGHTGQQAVGNDVKVQSVPADEGFWVGTSTTDRIWVQLTGKSGESPYRVKTGDTVDFTGVLTAEPAGFAARTGLTAAEGAALLTTQAQYVDVDKSALALSK